MDFLTESFLSPFVGILCTDFWDFKAPLEDCLDYDFYNGGNGAADGGF